MRTPSSAPQRGTVVVVGASARAWAASAVRGGWSVHAVDLFADGDLAALAESATCLAEGYPSALPAVVARLPHGPVTYTGGLENHPDVLSALARCRPLAGVPAGSLPALRTSAGLARVARAAGMASPAARRRSAGVPRGRSGRSLPTGIPPRAAASSRARAASHGDRPRVRYRRRPRRAAA